MVNIVLLASAIGTSALAITAFFSFIESKHQVNLMEKQLKHYIKISNPKLKINEFKFIANRIELDIENIGESNTYDISLMTSFFPYESKDGGKNFVPKQDCSLKDNDINVTETSDGILFGYENYNRIYLEPKRTRKIDFTPQFYIRYSRNDKGYKGRALKIEDLLKFSKENSLRYLLMNYALVYKNYLGEVLPAVNICRFIMDIENDPSLEVAYNLKRGPNNYAIPISEIGKQFQVVSYEDYKNLGLT